MEHIWWERVPSAIALSAAVIEQLLDEKSALLQFSSGFPWHDYFVEYIKEAVKQQNSSKSFELVCNVEDPGPYLLRTQCKAEKRAQYRPTKSFAQFFAESDDIVLHERYFWIRVGSVKEFDAWHSFVSEYVKSRGKGKATAAFVIEWHGDKNIRAKKGIRLISLDDYIGEYDRIVFATLAASSIKGDTFLKDYLTELTTAVVGNDIELAAECIKNYRSFLKNPAECIAMIIENNLRSDGSEFLFERSTEDVDRCVWKAQIKTIYPLIETFRGEFVKRHWDAIQKELPITSSYGEIYDSPEDVELGTLVYMVGTGRLKLEQEEYNLLEAYKNARNSLSHLTILSLEEVMALSL